jgi:hypothetical protein
MIRHFRNSLANRLKRRENSFFRPGTADAEQKLENPKVHRGSTGQLMTITANKVEENSTYTGPTVDTGSIHTSASMASMLHRKSEKHSAS